MSNTALIHHTITFVKQQLEGAEGGHDWFHIHRVYNNALLIAKGEACNLLVVQLGALLHDVADSKFHNGDETVGPKIARQFIENQDVDEEIIAHVIAIIENISLRAVILKGSLAVSSWTLYRMPTGWMPWAPLA